MHITSKKLLLILMIGIAVLVSIIIIGSIENKKIEDSCDVKPSNIYSCIAVGKGFEVTFYSSTNDIIFSEFFPKEPAIRPVTENIFEVSISVGSPAAYSFYIDMENAEISETFFNPLFIGERYIAYMEDGKLILRDAFNEDSLYIIISRDFTKTANPMSAIIAIEMQDRETFSLTYYKGDNYEKECEDISYTGKSKEEQYYDIWVAEHVFEIELGYNEFVTQDDIIHIGQFIHLKSLQISIGEGEIDLSPLGNLVELESLNIDFQDGCSPDLSFVANMSRLEELDITVGSGVDLSPLGGLNRLWYLSMNTWACNTNDLSFLKKLHCLREVVFNKCAIEDLSLFQDMPYLRELDVSYVDDCDLNDLADLKNLESLAIIGQNIRNPEGLSNLTHLEILSLDDNSLDARTNTEREPFDLQAFKNLKKLRLLDLTCINIEDISPLAELKKLRQIGLIKTNVRDISPLMSLGNLNQLHLFGNSSELVKEQAETFFNDIENIIVTEEIPPEFQ